MKNLKPLRIFVFCASVFALAKFFEAGRLIANEQTFSHVWLSISSLVFLAALFLIMGYWIYTDEKEKGNLRVKFGLYEWMYGYLKKKQGEK